MNGNRVEGSAPWCKSGLCYLGLGLVGLAAFLFISIALEDKFGVPSDTTYRIVCAVACVGCIYKLGGDYPGERWPETSMWLALLVNGGLFFTPLVDRPASRGEVMLFALPDIIILLVARIASYPVETVHQRAMRQQMIRALLWL
jgi:hypothetical protein